MPLLALTRGLFAEVDEEDFLRVAFINFYAFKSHNTWYANNRNEGLLHRVILRLSKDDPREVDHIDGNGLNCKKSNLRIASRLENGANRKSESKYKGVTFNSKLQKWRAQITREGKWQHIGYFKTAIEAAKAYNKMATLLFGEFANLNKIEEV